MTIAKTLVVIPSDPLEAYERAGYLQKLLYENYFNPAMAFEKVFVLSPLEPAGFRKLGKLAVIGATGLSHPEILAKLKPSLIRGYGGFWACDQAVYSSSLACPDIPLYISVHDTDPDILHDSVIYADKVHCTSNAVRKLVLTRGVAEHDAVVVPNYIDREIFRPQTSFPDFSSELGFMPGCKPILHVGRKRKQKNLETLIAALRYLHEEYVAVFIGRGNPSDYQMIANRLGVSNRCRWIEKVENGELPKWYSWCHVMCTPSRWEGFGIVFAEALACGARIVTSDIAPLNEFLVDGENAVLISEYENPSHLAAGIMRYSDIYFSEKISINARISSKIFDRNYVQAKEAKQMLTTKANGSRKSPAVREKALNFFQLHGCTHA